MFWICLGLSSVAMSTFFSKGSNAGYTSGQLILGISLTLVGQIFSAGQMVTEELFVRGKSFESLNVVGMEGLFGLCITSVAILPALYFIPDTGTLLANSFRDDSLDAMIQISNSLVLQIFCTLYVCSIAFFNFFGISLTKILSSVHRTIFDTLRTITVWAANLFIFYVLHLPQFGEEWSNWSYLQLGGFTLLIFGTLMYNEVFHLPCSTYAEVEPDKLALEQAEYLINEEEKTKG